MKLDKTTLVLSYIQICSLLAYLFLNISLVGQGGGYELVIIASIISFALILAFNAKSKFYIPFWFVMFGLFFLWYLLKIAVEVSEPLSYIKEVSVGTTGGILLFIVLGTITRVSVDSINAHNFFKNGKLISNKEGVFFLLLSFLSLLVLFLYFISRVRSDYFVIRDINGLYQRAGDFSSIAFIIISYITFSFMVTGKGGRFGLLKCFYFLSFLVLVLVTQLISSNSGTAVVMSVGLITFILIGAYSRKNITQKKLGFSLLFSLTGRFFVSIIPIGVVVALIVMGLSLLGVDVLKMNVFGFGSGELSSLSSRVNILKEQALLQLSYAPVFGDMNVAERTSGEDGKYLHSFFLYIFSHLGVVGLCLILLLLFMLFFQLFQSGTRETIEQYRSCYIYGFFVLLFLVLFANIAVSVSWIVLWFSIGFFVPLVRIVSRYHFNEISIKS